MAVTSDPVAFFAENAAKHLIAGTEEDPWEAAGAVFNRAYPYGMPMEEYALKTLRQARQAGAPEREKKLELLAQYRIVDRVISGEIGDATPGEREALEKARGAWRKRGPLKTCPEERRPAEGTVVVARGDGRPFTIGNVRWGTGFVEQRWMHQDGLGALIRRLVADPPEGYVVIAVAGKPAFSPSRLAFSGRRRFAVCHPDRTDYVDPGRCRRMQDAFAGVRPERKDLLRFRGLCRDRARTADTPPIDAELMRLADRWQRDAGALHDLLLPATDVELRALTDRRED